MLQSRAFSDELSPLINRELDCKGAVIKASILKNFPIVQSLGQCTPHYSSSQERESESQN